MELMTENTQTRAVTCKSHGDYEQTRTEYPDYFGEGTPRVMWHGSCTKCIDERIEKERKHEETMKRLDLMQRIRESGIPNKFLTCRLNNYVADNPGQKKALNIAHGYVEDFDAAYDAGRNLLLIGKPGCGKTHIACAIGMEVLEMDGTVRYTTVGNMVRRFTDTWRNRDGETESKVLADLTSAHLLILDEAGVQSGSDVEINKITEVIDGRYSKQIPTILVSNLGLDNLKPLLGDRVIDRLRDNGSKLATFDWASHRGKREAAK